MLVFASRERRIPWGFAEKSSQRGHFVCAMRGRVASYPTSDPGRARMPRHKGHDLRAARAAANFSGTARDGQIERIMREPRRSRARPREA